MDDLDSELAVAFLHRWPDLLTLKAVKSGVLKRFYYATNSAGPNCWSSASNSSAKPWP